MTEEMDREALLNAIDMAAPIRVTMNDGPSYATASLRDVAVDCNMCYLIRRDESGQYKAIWLSLVCMVRAEPVPVAA